ncbi:YhgE/Pip domain-containing protein [Brevibacillus sp. 7WMA2]|uniref:YhgE/Pip domain-containing protein n=1 Tax=Brevibacillus sp. 7WMA2 TaxID=2683193 RepID=UPI0013A761B9|nr:YhgE/Pip domain-containing protein [Brevibacillus sp. 7WMA2]QIC06848.1 YhgE/Pip domain-containing protein [Brevibacillus sp. 7WMA2]WPS87729.1 YhgE/Pip domain-containing protein [Brevibacillus halotolerans]
MNNIFKIFKRDVKKIATNWAAAIIICGLVFLPSLYAWFNIKASWDPYGQTSGIKIAVSNLDKGAELRGNKLNIGEEIITSLQENKKIGWVFTDSDNALRGVEHGEYYASITIPANFSERIATVLSKNPQKAEIIYNVNEKINAISPKITAKGASGVTEEVNRNFIKTANGTIFRIFNEIGIQLESELPTIRRLIELVYKVEASFPEVHQVISTASADLKKADDILKKAQSNLPVVTQLAQDAEKLSVHVGEFLDHSADAIGTLTPTIKENLLLIQQTAVLSEKLLGILQDVSFVPSLAKVELDRTAERLDRALSVTNRLIGVFEPLSNLTGKRLHFVTDKLKDIKSTFEKQQTIVTSIADALDRGERPAQQLVDQFMQLSRNTSQAIDDLLNRFDTQIEPLIMEGIEKAKQDANQARAVIKDAIASIPDVQQILQDAAKGLSLGSKDLLLLQKNLPEIEAKIKDVAKRIRALEKEGNLEEVIDLLKRNAEKESQFFAEPVILKENRMFPIPNYGSAMSPFFTTLSLWVGALLLVSLLSVEVHDEKHVFKSYEVYFGRYLTFGLLAMLQSVMVTMGDIYILGAYVANKMWFVLFGLIISAVFMLIVYTLVSVFGNVGKAMAIVLLVLQLAGSGGTFPIQVTPPFFQAIYPFLPFTYAISMMREAVGGILWDIINRDIIMMTVYAGIALIIGLALKKFINRSSAKLVKKAKESQLIH